MFTISCVCSDWWFPVCTTFVCVVARYQWQIQLHPLKTSAGGRIVIHIFGDQTRDFSATLMSRYRSIRTWRVDRDRRAVENCQLLTIRSTALTSEHGQWWESVKVVENVSRAALSSRRP